MHTSLMQSKKTEAHKKIIFARVLLKRHDLLSLTPQSQLSQMSHLRQYGHQGDDARVVNMVRWWRSDVDVRRMH